MRSYDLFLFDLDDTLLDFRASETKSFVIAMEALGLRDQTADLYREYQIVNPALWKAFEEGKTTKEHLKVERFRQIFASQKIAVDPEEASHRYLETLPDTVVLIDHAVEVCAHLSQWGEIGIVTNGIHTVQTLRIQNSALAPYISFTCVSEDCGFAKPDIRFFEHSSHMARSFAKEKTLVIGDRVDIDVQGAMNFGVDSCWYNPKKDAVPEGLKPSYQVHHLADLKNISRK